MTLTASTRSLAARRAAAAGLLSSCASPAAIVPSDVSRSRLASRACDAAHHRADHVHHALVDDRLRERELDELRRAG